MKHTIRIEVDVESDCPEVRARLAGHRSYMRQRISDDLLEAIWVGWPEERYGGRREDYREPKATGFRMRVVHGPADTFRGN